MLDSNLINIQSLYCSTLNSRDFKCTWEQVSCRIQDHGVPVKVSSGSRQPPHPLLPVAYRSLHQGFPRVISRRIHWSTLRSYTVAGFVPVGLHSSLWTFQKGCRFSTLKAWIISQSLQYVSLSSRFPYNPFLVLHDNTLDGKVSALGLGRGREKRGSESREGGRTFNKKKISILRQFRHAHHLQIISRDRLKLKCVLLGDQGRCTQLVGELALISRNEPGLSSMNQYAKQSKTMEGRCHNWLGVSLLQNRAIVGSTRAIRTGVVEFKLVTNAPH